MQDNNKDKYEYRQIKGKYYCCKRLKMLEWLINEGFRPTHKAPDINNPTYTVWFFDNSDGLEEAVNEYYRRYYVDGVSTLQ